MAAAWCEFLRQAPERAEVRLSHFLDWCDEWLGTVPASRSHEYLPLADHLRTMAAVAAASGGEEECLVVLGDISGIQSYLFDISHIGAGKVGKRLRARSFFLGLFSEAAAHKLLRQLELPLTCLLLAAGGVFYLVLPKGTEVDIERWKADVNEELYEKYHGSISMHVACENVSLRTVQKEFSSVLSSLHQQIQHSKGQPFSHVLMDGGQWTERFLHDWDQAIDPCHSCHRHPIKLGHDQFCEWCALDETLGTRLPHTKYLLFRADDQGIPILQGVSVELAKELPVTGDSFYLVQGWNLAARPSGWNVPFQRKWMANYVPLAPKGGCPHCLEQRAEDPIGEAEPLSFACLAHAAAGKPLLAYAKADVDNLGMLLSFGLWDDGTESGYGLAYIATLSRMLERFFAGGIHQWLSGTYPRLYTVFSGGDDLFLVGPWDEAIEAMKFIGQEFERYVGGNRDVTLSAGISIVKHMLPLPHVTREVEEALEAAKEEPNWRRCANNQQGAGRNQVCVRNRTMEWNDLDHAVYLMKRMGSWLKQGAISTAFLRMLLQLEEFYQSYRTGQDKRAIRFVPLLAYQIARSGEECPKQAQAAYAEARQWLETLLAFQDEEGRRNWELLRPAVELALLSRQERKGNAHAV